MKPLLDARSIVTYSRYGWCCRRQALQLLQLDLQVLHSTITAGHRQVGIHLDLVNARLPNAVSFLDRFVAYLAAGQ